MIEEEKIQQSSRQADEFLHVFRKGAEFTRELLKENEQLRLRLARYQDKYGVEKSETVISSPEVEKLRQRTVELEREKQEVLGQVKKVESENLDFANRYVEIEHENNMLANLYIASNQLHSTLDSAEVLQITSEILINLIGAEEFAVLLVDEKIQKLKAVLCEGVVPDDFPGIEFGEGLIGQLLKTGESYYCEDPSTYEKDLSIPLVCIPLKVRERVIGSVLIYAFLSPKKKFAEIDYQLFSLFAGHAATAIFSSRMYSDAERRMTTIQGFLDLMTKQ